MDLYSLLRGSRLLFIRSRWDFCKLMVIKIKLFRTMLVYWKGLLYQTRNLSGISYIKLDLHF